MHQVIQSFNAGEITPHLRYRTEVQHHASAVERMENFIPLPFGGVRKRPGTLHRAVLSAPTRLEPFHVSTGTAYVLGVTTDAVTVFRRDGSVAATLAEVTPPDPAADVPDDPDGGSLGDTPDPVPFAVADPFAIQILQLNDVAFFTAPDLTPLRLTRRADTDWVLEEIPFSFPPLLDENAVDALTIDCRTTDAPATDEWTAGTHYVKGDRVTVTDTVSGVTTVRTYSCMLANVAATATKPGHSFLWFWVWALVPTGTGDTSTDTSVPAGQSLPLVASKPLFDAGHVGAVFQVSKKRGLDDFQVEYEATTANDTGTHADARSKWLVVQGHWSLITFGTWHGAWVIEKSEDRGLTWIDYRKYEADGDRNVSAEGEETKRVLLRMRWTHGSGTDSNGKAVLSVEDAFIRGLVKVTEVVDAMNATAVAVTPVEPCITEYWAEGAFSTYQGFPRTVVIHERRLVFAGTQRKGDSLWFSKTDDLLNFLTGTVADDAIHITLATTRQDPIQWLASQRRLFVGTTGGEWVFGSETSDEPISPATVLVREYTRYGSAALPSLTFNDSIYYIERQGRRLREMAFEIERQSYDAADLTRLAEHITAGGVIQMARQDNREPVLWCVRADGTLLAFVYKRAEELAAWTRHTTCGGLFRSVAVLRNLTGDDEVFAVVERNGVFHLEAFASGQQALQEAGDLAACHHLDAGVFYDGGETTTSTVSGLDHLDGQEVSVFADGTVSTATVAGGHVTLPSPALRVHVGLPVDSVLRSLPLDVNADTGPTTFRMKRAHEILLDVFESRGGQLQTGDEAPAALDYSRASDWLGPVSAFTGLMARTLPGGFVRDLSYTIRHDEPHPFIARAVVVRWQIHEP